MVKTKEVIKLNGKRYDAENGRLLISDMAPKTSKGSKIGHLSHKSPATALHTKTMRTNVKYRAKSLGSAPDTKQISTPSRSPRPVHQLKAHSPQKAQTLARMGLNKPAPLSLKARLKVHAPITSSLSRKSLPALKSKTVDPARLERASAISPSQLVRHFRAEAKAEPLKPMIKPMPVRQAEPAPGLAAPKPDASYFGKPHQRKFEAAIATATSHEQAPPKTKQARRIRHRWLTILVLLVIVLAGGGWLAIIKLPQIDMALASLHAGFSAKLPSYTPTGFSPSDHMASSNDQVVVTYRNASSQSYTITQQVSNWDNQTLQDFIKSTGDRSQSWQNIGNTFYAYDNHFTWVSGDIWYQIANNANLSDATLLKIASSF